MVSRIFRLSIVCRTESPSFSEQFTKRDRMSDDPCYRLAERIYCLEKLKLEQQSVLSKSTENDAESDHESHSENDNVIPIHASQLMSPAVSANWIPCGIENNDNQSISQQGSARSESVASSRSAESRPPLWTTARSSDLTMITLKRGDAGVMEFDNVSTSNSTDIESPNTDDSKLHHVSTFSDVPSMVYHDPFDEPEDHQFWPFSIGSSVWNFMAGNTEKSVPQKSIDFHVESSISSFYTKEGEI